MKLEFSDGSNYVADNGSDTFFIGFNNNLDLRESCYNCKYTGVERISDFTVGDFWGVTPERATEKQRKEGISLLLVNSEKGNGILERLYDSLEITPIDPDEAIPYNHALVEPNDRPNNRGEFFSALKKGKDYNSLIKKMFAKKYIKNRVRRVAKKILGNNRYEKVKAMVKNI